MSTCGPFKWTSRDRFATRECTARDTHPTSIAPTWTWITTPSRRPFGDYVTTFWRPPFLFPPNPAFLDCFVGLVNLDSSSGLPVILWNGIEPWFSIFQAVCRNMGGKCIISSQLRYSRFPFEMHHFYNANKSPHLHVNWVERGCPFFQILTWI